MQALLIDNQSSLSSQSHESKTSQEKCLFVSQNSQTKKTLAKMKKWQQRGIKNVIKSEKYEDIQLQKFNSKCKL